MQVSGGPLFFGLSRAFLARPDSDPALQISYGRKNTFVLIACESRIRSNSYRLQQSIKKFLTIRTVQRWRGRWWVLLTGDAAGGFPPLAGVAVMAA